jgi:spore coat polysaccharide biosynthesis protein SpsF
VTPVAIVVQARMSSRRLPNKVLMPLAGAPSLVQMIHRLRMVKNADALVVATSTEASDDPVEATCREHGVDVHRGSLDDVLARVLDAAPAGHDVVRLTADCPLIDPALVDLCIERFFASPDAGYVTNAVERTYPDGFDVEVVRRAWLERARDEATDTYDREHVTPWVRRNAPRVDVTQDVDLAAIRLTLDEPEDYAIIAAVYEALGPDATTPQIYALLKKRPELIRLATEEAVETYVARLETLS